MGKIIETSITKFDGGMTTDPLTTRSNVGQLVKHFDPFTFPHKLVPYRSSESAVTSPDTTKYANFLYTNSKLYALGVVSGTGRAQIDYKDDFSGTAWSTPANAQSSAGSRNTDLFVYYAKTNKIYGLRAFTHVWSYGIASTTWNDTEADLTAYTTAVQGLVHSKDDVLYIAHDNKISKNNNGSWSVAFLTLPSKYTITSLCEYGNYLAIACKANAGENSRVFLWDRDSSVATLDESIDWGNGALNILEEVEGMLVGVSLIGSSALSFKSRLGFRYYTGNGAKQFAELVSSSATATLPLAKQKINSRLYFMADLTLNGVQHQGVWSIGRNSEGAPFAVAFEYLPNNDTALDSGTLVNFFLLGDYMLIAYTSSTAFGLSKTDDQQTSYTATSIYETRTFNFEDSSIVKKLIGAAVTHEYLPASGSVTLKYKKDEETSFTTILTNTTDNSVSEDAVRKSDGTTLPEFKEITFRIESTGGAVVTGLHFTSEVIGKRSYD